MIAVVYIEDGYEGSRKFIYKIFENYLKTLPKDDDLKDSKTKLQELLQAKNCDLPEYVTIEINQKNEKSFKTLCRIHNYNISTEGLGSSKRKISAKGRRNCFRKIEYYGAKINDCWRKYFNSW